MAAPMLKSYIRGNRFKRQGCDTLQIEALEEKPAA
jgi:hypothetical protein